MKAILIVVMVLFSGCAMFRKSSKITTKETERASRKTELQEFILKSANKETQVFTYWNDSGFYQYQHIKEQVEQAGGERLTIQEEERATKALTQKESEPVRTWVYTGIALMVMCVWGAYKYHKKPLHL